MIRRLLPIGLAALLAAVVLAPFGAVLAAAGAGDPLRALAAPVARRALAHTLVTGLGGATLASLLGGGFALLTGLLPVPGRRMLGFLFVLLLVIPPQITAVAWIALLGPGGPLGFPGAERALFGPWGIGLLLGIEQAPLVYLSVRGGLRAIPAELCDAARTAGAAPARVMRTIVLPLLLPSLAGGVSLAFSASVANFAIPALLGIPGRYVVLTTLIYQRLTGFGPQALGGVAALSGLLAALALMGVALDGWVGGARDVRVGAVAAPVGFHPRRGAWLAGAACWGAVLLLLVLPGAALVAGALVRAYGEALGPGTITLAHLARVLSDPTEIQAILNSLLLAGSAAVLLALGASLAASLPGGKATGGAMRLADLPYVLPGQVLAIGCVLLFLRPIAGIALYDTLGIILFAYLVRFLALARRPVTAAARAMDPSLAEAASSCGAGRLRRARTITLPLLAPAAIAGGLMVFLSAFGEVTVSSLLWSGGTETLGVAVFERDQAGALPDAAALSVVGAAVVITLMATAAALGRRLPAGTLPWTR